MMTSKFGGIPVDSGSRFGGIPVADEEVKQEKASYFRGLLQTIAKGQTMGWSDNITGALVAAAAEIKDIVTPGNDGQTFGEVYRDVSSAERMGQEQFAQENPKTAIGAELVGGLTTGGVGASKIAGAKVFQGAKTVLGKTAQKVGAQAAAAAPIGAVYGAGVSDEGDRLEGAAKGAAISAAVGPVLGAVAGATTRGTRAIANLFQSSETRTFNKATQQIARGISRDSDTAEGILARTKDLGPEGTLVDAGKVNLKRELERAASTPGQAPEITERFLVGRLSRSGARIDNIFGKYVGKSTKDAQKTVDELGSSAAAEAAPYYAKAYETVVNNADEKLTALLNNPRVKKAIQPAIDRIKSKTPIGPEREAVMKQLQSELDPENPSMILWDHIKRQLDDDASTAYGSGASSLGKDIADNARTLRNALDLQSKDYEKARSIWAGSSRAEEAFLDGMNFDKGLNNPLTGAVAKANKFNDLSQSEKDLFRKGVSTRVRQMITTAGDTANNVPPASLYKKIWGNKEIRSIINTVIPDKQGRVELRKALEAEAQFRVTTNEILGNSKTALRQELLKEPQAQINEAAGQAVNLLFAIRGSYFAIGRGISTLTKGSAPNEKVNAEVARQLSAKGEAAIEGVLKNVDRYLTLPKEAGNAVEKLMKIPKGKRMDFLRANPQIKKEIDRSVAALVAGMYASGKVKSEQESK
jgi:hypothetical protein